MLVSDTPKNRTLIKKAELKTLNREWKIKDGLTFIGDIAIALYWPNQVMFIVATEQDPFGLIISSYYLYETLLRIFEFLRRDCKRGKDHIKNV